MRGASNAARRAARSGTALLLAVAVCAGPAGAQETREADEAQEDRLAVLGPDGTPGDPDYGAYLAQECAACHVAGGAASVPGIDGIAPGYFRLAMDEYASGTRDNAAMASVARSLGDKELAALAAHFATLTTMD